MSIYQNNSHVFYSNICALSSHKFMANNGATCGFQFVNLEFKEYQKVAGYSYYIYNTVALLDYVT